jgi:hypothetical protein
MTWKWWNLGLISHEIESNKEKHWSLIVFILFEWFDNKICEQLNWRNIRCWYYKIKQRQNITKQNKQKQKQQQQTTKKIIKNKQSNTKNDYHANKEIVAYIL